MEEFFLLFSRSQHFGQLKLIEVQLGADINVHDKQKFELER